MRKRIEDLTPDEAEQAAGMIAALRAKGVEPTHAFMPPYPSTSAAARRDRQERAKAHKQAEAGRRRESAAG